MKQACSVHYLPVIISISNAVDRTSDQVDCNFKFLADVYVPCQNAEHSGLLAKYGSIGAVDKACDKDVSIQHDFLRMRKRLEDLKVEKPGIRLSSGSHLLREQLEAREKSAQGLRAPKKQFVEISAYKKRFGEPQPSQVKEMVYNGKRIRGVDVIKEEDVPCYDFHVWPYF